MDFGSEYAYVPTAAEQEYELVPESVYNHTVVGYASKTGDYKDDGEVIYTIFNAGPTDTSFLFSQTCLLDILDTAGQEEFSSMRDQVSLLVLCCFIVVAIVLLLFFLQYVRQGDCFMLVYSITSRSSFEEAQAMYRWISRIRDKNMPVVSVFIQHSNRIS